MNKEKIAIISSFILIFAFNAIDNAISPLVNPISKTFGIAEASALLLISVCSGATALALLLGPALISMGRAKKMLLGTVLAMGIAQTGFALTSSFAAAIIFRMAAGFAAGLIATLMWRITFHGVSKDNFPAIIAVLMSARPLATAIGVPLAGLLAWKIAWQLPMEIIAALTTGSGLLLYAFFPEKADMPLEENKSSGIIKPYVKALSVPHALNYYIGITINRMAYFGFYSFCGIWFYKHYGMNIKDISFALLIIGLAEAAVNFSTNKIIKIFGQKKTLLASIGISAVLLPLFIYGKFAAGLTIGMIAAFMLLDRVYSMALIITIPQMFPSTGDKTAFGSLNTLTAWGAMMLIAGFQSRFADILGIHAMETVILACFFISAAMLIRIQYKTVLKSGETLNKSEKTIQK